MEQKKFDHKFLYRNDIIRRYFIMVYVIKPRRNLPSEETTEDNCRCYPKHKTATLSKYGNTCFKKRLFKKCCTAKQIRRFCIQCYQGTPGGTTVLENELLKLTIDNKGGQIIEA